MTTTRKIMLPEDWTAVFLGGLVILLALSGLVIQDPLFKWKSGVDVGDIFTAHNWALLGKQALFVLMVSGIGAWLTARPVINYLKGLIVVYLITLVALFIAGNEAVKNWNFEAVIFSL